MTWDECRSADDVSSTANRAFGPKQSWNAIYHVVDHYADVQPEAPAIEDAAGSWTYAQLRDASMQVAVLLRQKGLLETASSSSLESKSAAPRPLAVRVVRCREFYALCLGAWRLGLPVVAMSNDMADKSVEADRNLQIMRSLKPLALVADEDSRQLLDEHSDMALISWSDITAGMQSCCTQHCQSDAPISPESIMVYVYTGGTTKASKCVAVTHAMALWEAENYSLVLGGTAGVGDKMLQYSSLYWGAAVFGQISVGLAVGACVCIGGCPKGCSGAGDALQQIVSDVKNFGITVLGIVPSQLRGAWPGGPSTAPSCLRKLIAWADKCPVDLSRQWHGHGIEMVDLLIASEYWLALYSDCRVWTESGVEKHIYKKLPSLDARFLIQDDKNDGLRDAVVGEVGEMYLAGPTVSPGYVCPDGCIGLDFYGAARTIDGRTYLRTRDQLLLLPDGGLVYSGRADSMMKHGGQWVDADAMQDKACAVPGIAQAAVLPGAHGVDVFIVMQAAVSDSSIGTEADADGSPLKKLRTRSTTPPFRVLADARKALPGARLHVCTEIPLNAATAKIDRKALTAQLDEKQQERQEHLRAQEEVERQHIACYGHWRLLMIGIVCGSQALHAAQQLLQAMRHGDGAFSISSTMCYLCVACFARLALMPIIWAATAYVEFQLNPPGLGPWYPANDRLAAVLGRFRLPRQFSRWLPVVLAAVLPLYGLIFLTAIACSYLPAVRGHGFAVVAGFVATELSAAMHICCVDASPMLVLTLGLLGVATLALAGETRDFVCYLLSTPGVFYQTIPKFLVDDFGWVFEKRSSRLQTPGFKDRLVFSEKGIQVAEDNKWDQVCLSGPKGENAWYSQGLVVNLHWELAKSESLAPALKDDATVEPQVSGSAGGCRNSSANPLAALVERIYGANGSGSLHGIDSMQAIQLAEGVRRDFGKSVSVSDVLRCGDIDELAEVLEKANNTSASSNGRVAAKPDPSPYRRIWLCGMGPRACTVDWLVCQDDRTRHLDVPALCRSMDRLVKRHGALRARNAPEQPMFIATYEAASLWQLSCSAGHSWTHSTFGKLVSKSVFQAWPRSRMIAPESEEARVQVLRPVVGDVVSEQNWEASRDDELAFYIGGVLHGRRKQNGQLFNMCIVPVFKDARGASPDDDAIEVALTLPPEEVKWYLYAVLDHGYCDGPTGLPLFADLLRLYAQESGIPGAEPPSEAPDALSVLQQRLRRSLLPLPEAEHPNDDMFHDSLVDWGMREGYQRFIQLDLNMNKVLRYASRSMLGCSVDVTWLTAISAAFLRLFPDIGRLDLYLVVTCRDNPAEESMVGYFSSRKMLPLEVGDPTTMALLGLSDIISTARRQRNWHRPRPFEKCSRACIEVNVVGQATDGLPCGFREVRYAKSAPRSWNRNGTSCMQVRLDQTARDAWDFRLQSHDATWGGNWSTYFAQALGSVLVDMALRPAGPVAYRARDGEGK